MVQENNIAGKVEDGGRSNNMSSSAMWVVKDGTVDYKGRPADRRKTGGWRAAPLIFGTKKKNQLNYHHAVTFTCPTSEIHSNKVFLKFFVIKHKGESHTHTHIYAHMDVRT